MLGEEMRPALQKNWKLHGRREGRTDMLIAILLRLFSRGVKSIGITKKKNIVWKNFFQWFECNQFEENRFSMTAATIFQRFLFCILYEYAGLYESYIYIWVRMYIYMSLPFFGSMRVRLWYLTVCGSSIALHKTSVPLGCNHFCWYPKCRVNRFCPWERHVLTGMLS